MLRGLLRLGSLAACAVLVAVRVATAATPSTLTLTYPTLPPPGVPDTDGYLNPAAQTFQEGGMHVESFWVKNNLLNFSPDAHFHIKYPNPFEITHGFGNVAGLGPDRQGIYLRREDGGPFDLVRLDYRAVQPTSTNLMIGPSFNPALPATSQLTLFPVTADPNFQQLAPTGFTNLTQLFLAWDLTEAITDSAQLDNIVVSFPTGSCSQSVPGGIVVSHAQNHDPATEGWTVEGAGTGVTTGPVVDQDFDAWAVDDNSTAAGSSRSYAYFPSPDVMCWARTSGFTLRAKVRVVDLPDAVDGSVLVAFSDSAQVFELRLGQTGTGHPIVWVSGTSVTLGNLDSGYHVYELIYDPATATVDLKVDGTEVLSNRPGLAQNVAPPRVRFGSAYDFGSGQGNYAFVEFDLPMRCANGVDDDGDGNVDYPADPGCSSATDNTETGACANGLDDDGDGSTDYPADLGCASTDDDSEHDPALVCDDGADNDGDALADFPADPGCASPGDLTETAACENGADDDGDGLADYPADPGCDGASDDSELSAGLACDDGVDNDGDALVDFPADPGCTSPADATETAACSDGVDDDGDGLTDFPADPGCADANDDSERSPTLACDDGVDNDGDTLADYPADPDCTSPSDATEAAACSDGVDDDGDGLIDFPADPGCADANDDSERSPALACDDGIDNDGDGAIDYPADPGCQLPTSLLENPKCQDGLDNDADGTIDFDGGAFLNGGAPTGPADPDCIAKPWRDREAPGRACGLGADVALVLPIIAALRRRRRRS